MEFLSRTNKACILSAALVNAFSWPINEIAWLATQTKSAFGGHSPAHTVS
jgi:hypothetical protein